MPFRSYHDPPALRFWPPSWAAQEMQNTSSGLDDLDMALLDVLESLDPLEYTLVRLRDRFAEPSLDRYAQRRQSQPDCDLSAHTKRPDHSGLRLTEGATLKEMDVPPPCVMQPAWCSVKWQETARYSCAGQASEPHKVCVGASSAGGGGVDINISMDKRINSFAGSCGSLHSDASDLSNVPSDGELWQLSTPVNMHSPPTQTFLPQAPNRGNPAGVEKPLYKPAVHQYMHGQTVTTGIMMTDAMPLSSDYTLVDMVDDGHLACTGPDTCLCSSPTHSLTSSGDECIATTAPRHRRQRRRCLGCSTYRTPQWRSGPAGPRTLCNACGMKYKKGISLS